MNPLGEALVGSHPELGHFHTVKERNKDKEATDYTHAVDKETGRIRSWTNKNKSMILTENDVFANKKSLE